MRRRPCRRTAGRQGSRPGPLGDELRPDASSITGPPPSGTFLIAPAAQKATHWPSAETAGTCAPSVLGSGRASARVEPPHVELLHAAPPAHEDQRLPVRAPGQRRARSTGVANVPDVPPAFSSSAGRTSRLGRTSDTRRRGRAQQPHQRRRQPIGQRDRPPPRAPPAARVRAAAEQPSTAPMPLVCAIHRSSSATSCAVSQRSSGCFARHFFTTRSSAGGVQRLQRGQRGRLRVHDVADEAHLRCRPRTPAVPVTIS